MTEPFALAIHGGAGAMRQAAMNPAASGKFHAGLRTSLLAGHAVLAKGGSAVDAVSAAVMALEDNPLFNAGRGAVFTRAGSQEMGAAIMRGEDRPPAPSRGSVARKIRSLPRAP